MFVFGFYKHSKNTCFDRPMNLPLFLYHFLNAKIKTAALMSGKVCVIFVLADFSLDLKNQENRLKKVSGRGSQGIKC